MAWAPLLSYFPHLISESFMSSFGLLKALSSVLPQKIWLILCDVFLLSLILNEVERKRVLGKVGLLLLHISMHHGLLKKQRRRSNNNNE
jgi:hypothetical protein